MEALERFLSQDSRFRVDRSREKLLVTLQPNGYLLKEPRADSGGPPPGRWRMSSLVPMSLEDLTEQIRLKDVELDKAAEYAEKLLKEIEAKDGEIDRMARHIRRLESEQQAPS